MILSCILLRKMDNVVVSGFGAAIGLGRFGEIWALAKDAKTETDTMTTRITTRTMDRNIKILQHLRVGDATGIDELGRARVSWNPRDRRDVFQWLVALL